MTLRGIFENFDNKIICVNGEVIADGANSPGLSFEEGMLLLAQYEHRPKPKPFFRTIKGAYGCNMAFRTSSICGIRFDERLPLYGWQEDLDFCGALRGRGPNCLKSESDLGRPSRHQARQRQRSPARLFPNDQPGVHLDQGKYVNRICRPADDPKLPRQSD